MHFVPHLLIDASGGPVCLLTCTGQKNRILRQGDSPFSATYMGAKFNYFYALAGLKGQVAKHFDKLKAMYDDFHRQANAEGWQPVKLERFESSN